MRKILFTFCALFVAAGMTFAQVEEKTTPKKDKSINHEWQQAIDEAADALRNVEIPDIDVDEIMEDVKEAMPTREEIADYKEIVAEAVGELRNIDLSGLEEALAELRAELGDIFEDHNDERRKEKKKDER